MVLGIRVWPIPSDASGTGGGSGWLAVLAHGFLRLLCDACGHDRLVAFSCNRRRFCPSCGGRRVADTAAHLVDRVFPTVPIRQWVLTLPHSLRCRCAYDARLASDVLCAFVRSLFSELRRRARNHWNLRLAQCGALTFVQRFGSAMNLNLHFHTLALDGVFPYALSRDREPRFFPLPAPDPSDVARVLAGTARRIRRILEQRAAKIVYARSGRTFAISGKRSGFSIVSIPRSTSRSGQ